MTAAVLPWAILAGAARNLRIHFGEQVFLLREQTRIPLVNDVIDGISTIAGGFIGLLLAGLPGSVAGAAIGALLSLSSHWAVATTRTASSCRWPIWRGSQAPRPP